MRDERTSQAREHEAAWWEQRAELDRWRRQVRPRLLRAIATRTIDLQWSQPLFAALLDELYVGDDFVELVGDPDKLPIRRYPHAVAVALATRHSWRPDDLAELIARLGLSLEHATSGPPEPDSRRTLRPNRTPRTKRAKRSKSARR